jgi:hypothetical protein
MSVQSVSLRKAREHRDLLFRVSSSSIPADMPCTLCFKNGIDCQIKPGAARCTECVRRKVSCDGVLVASTLRRLDQQKQRLEDDEEAAEQRLVELQSQLSEAVGRLSRIRKIRKRVQNRSAELVERGLAELDKEVSGPPPDLLPALAAHEEWMVTDLRDMGVPNDADWSALGLSDFADVGPLVSSSEAPRPSETV